MKILLLTCSLLVFCSLSQAQIVVQKTTNGLVTQMQIGQKATSADVYAAFGKPDKQESHYDDAAGGFMSVYKYRDFSIRIVEGTVYNFGLGSNVYTVRVHNKYVAKVGMPIQTFRNSIPASEVRIETRDNNIIFRFKIAGTDDLSDDALFVVLDSQGIIRDIFWHVPV